MIEAVDVRRLERRKQPRAALARLPQDRLRDAAVEAPQDGLAREAEEGLAPRNYPTGPLGYQPTNGNITAKSGHSPLVNQGDGSE